ncbi:fanconi-associated nuclease 1 homolog isoform X1 [Zingiber officinale]|uniref:fanconi-associated nuclease 1 homolog isoform X1 n=1 Tax=Zingiber officinale TaxID=94328 RepID=UPI001C4D4F65|nr:fanconi-associated nuclease 1 homolog isoform X1 [Zingiber officinale]
MTVMPSCITEMAGEPSSIKADPSDSSRRLRSIRAREPIESAMHLHGWESLKRLIGKRRRTISLDLSRLLSPSNSQSNSTHDGIHHGETQASTSSDEKDWAPKSELHGAFDKEWVSCPVCGRLIRGIDYNVNSHLDACLTRGTKRKLTQSNLLQFQFSKRNRTEPILDDIYSEEADNACTEYNHENECGNAFALPKDLSGIRHGNICESDPSDNFPSHLGNFTKTLPPENTFLGDSINQVVDSCDPYICPHLNKDELDETKDANCVMTFVSYIVGRRFHASVELQQGARILLARNSKNVKDRNAIMVLGADSDCRVMLGYLPRELSKYLSPLIDNHYIECEARLI